MSQPQGDAGTDSTSHLNTVKLCECAPVGVPRLDQVMCFFTKKASAFPDVITVLAWDLRQGEAGKRRQATMNQMKSEEIMRGRADLGAASSEGVDEKFMKRRTACT